MVCDVSSWFVMSRHGSSWFIMVHHGLSWFTWWFMMFRGGS